MGYLLNGKPICGTVYGATLFRVCARTPGHKGSHRDLEAMARENYREKRRRELNDAQLRTYEKGRNTAERRAASHKTRPFPASEHGFCYLLTAPWVPKGLLKIGSCTDLKGNLKAARRYLPGAEHVRLYEGYRRLEYYLHNEFEDRRMFGGLTEWFKIPAEEVDAVVAEVSRTGNMHYHRR